MAVVARFVGHNRLATTTDLDTRLFSPDAERVSSAVGSAVDDAAQAESARHRRSSRAWRARPEGLEPPTSRVETGGSIR